MPKILVALCTAFLLSVQGVQAADYVAGTHYEVLPTPVATRDKNKIEVVALFWYGCSHCFSFEPMLNSWKTNLPADVDLHHTPAVWNATMKLHAQAFYTARALGVMDKFHQPFFNAMHVERQRLGTESSVEQFFEKIGVDNKKFKTTFNSFGVTSQVKLAESRASSYRMQGTPELVVNGKYRIATALAGSHSEMIKVAEHLIEIERAGRRK